MTFEADPSHKPDSPMFCLLLGLEEVCVLFECPLLYIIFQSVNVKTNLVYITNSEVAKCSAAVIWHQLPHQLVSLVGAYDNTLTRICTIFISDWILIFCLDCQDRRWSIFDFDYRSSAPHRTAATPLLSKKYLTTTTALPVCQYRSHLCMISFFAIKCLCPHFLQSTTWCFLLTVSCW